MEIDELVRGVNIALGRQAASTCMAFDGNADGGVPSKSWLSAFTTRSTHVLFDTLELSESI